MKKCDKKFFEKFDSATYKELVNNICELSGILVNTNSRIITELLVNVMNFYHKREMIIAISEINKYEQAVIEELKKIGYKFKIDEEYDINGCTYYITVSWT